MQLHILHQVVAQAQIPIKLHVDIQHCTAVSFRTDSVPYLMQHDSNCQLHQLASLPRCNLVCTAALSAGPPRAAACQRLGSRAGSSDTGKMN